MTRPSLLHGRWFSSSVGADAHCYHHRFSTVFLHAMSFTAASPINSFAFAALSFLLFFCLNACLILIDPLERRWRALFIHSSFLFRASYFLLNILYYTRRRGIYIYIHVNSLVPCYSVTGTTPVAKTKRRKWWRTRSHHGPYTAANSSSGPR